MIASAVVAMSLVGFGVALSLLPSSLTPACDAIVQQLLTTNDRLEFERARYLTDKLRCGVASRLNGWPSDGSRPR